MIFVEFSVCIVTFYFGQMFLSLLDTCLIIHCVINVVYLVYITYDDMLSHFLQ